MSNQAYFFHGHEDTDFTISSGAIAKFNPMQLQITQEREVSYRFYPHFHPYVGQLMQKLLRQGTPNLQAADTKYDPDGALLPGSIEIALGSNTQLTVPAGSRIALLSELIVNSGGVGIQLAANMEFRLDGDVQAKLPNGMKASFVDGMTHTPSADPFNLEENRRAVVFGDTEITLSAAAPIVLYDGKKATIPVGTQVLLVGGTELTLPKNIQVTLLKSKPRPELFAEFFEDAYTPNPALVRRPYPVRDLDFTSSGAYSVYNWELFFHVPLTVAMHLSKNQRYAEAQHWFHYLFDPTDSSDGPTPERYWKVRPFQYTDVKKMEEILTNLVTGADPDLQRETLRSIDNWKSHPFRPHVIARYRQQAYMYKTVMAYLDNLIAWGDSLFRQDTGEAIDEALMLYVLAANILGPRPQLVPKKGAVRPQTYDNLSKDLKEFGTVLRTIEPYIPFDLMPILDEGANDNAGLVTIRSIGQTLYFCVPRNDKLLSYWDTVADRLFKIHNSLNIQGIFRQLPLFEPPIDPAMLARAAAAGLDVGAIVNGLNQPLPLVRFQLLAQKAAEICQEVKSLGNNLLSAMEKEDGEALAILRARHERVVMQLVEHVKYSQLQEAIKSREGLLQSLALAVQRYTYYERQLGKKPDEIQKAIPELGELDKDNLEKMKLAMKEPEVNPRSIEVDIAQDIGASGGKIISSHELRELELSESAMKLRQSAADRDMIAKFLTLIPELGAHAQPLGVGAVIQFGGRALSTEISLMADGDRMISDRKTHEAGKAAKIGGYARREQDWAFQSNLAAGEIAQIFKQLRATQIREAIAELELKNHRQQMKHAEEIEYFLNEEGTEKTGKKTNKALYAWMKREVKGLYGQVFQFAFDIAKKAERALQHELGNPNLSYLQFGYLAGKEGLLAGERLYLDVKRMEMAYHDLNLREYELTKHVSLLQVDPLALLQLRTTGRCTVSLPESLFDMDGPGHYFRRIKTVAVSIPCVTGPYASVNCTLTLLKSSIRKNQLLRGDVYDREDAEDDRFSDYFGSMQSIVTSSAQNDSGMFETNLRDERYLPFEGSGVISEWQLELPADVRQFDYDTISDVILHIRYTAREGGGLLRKGAVKNLQEAIKEATAAGSVRLFSMRHEFSTAWAKFSSTKIGDEIAIAKLTLDLSTEHYPFWSRNQLKAVTRAEVFTRGGKIGCVISQVIDTANGEVVEQLGTLAKDASLGVLLRAPLAKLSLEQPTGDFAQVPTGRLELCFTDNAMDDLWLAVAWSG